MRLNRNLIIALAGTFLIALTLVGISLVVWVYKLDQEIALRFAEKRFASPVEFFSAPERVVAGAELPTGYLETTLKRKHFRLRDFGLPLQPGDYSLWTGEQCRQVLAAYNLATVQSCLSFRNFEEKSEAQIVAFETAAKVFSTYAGPSASPSLAAELEPEMFAQYYGNVPILRKIVPLGEAPANCLNALLAIEDSQFYEHGAISFTSLARALWTDLKSGRKDQGGSTLTQQLVKNYFLTSEKSLRRKAKEFVMSVLVENRVSKDDILETYINLILMGVSGPFEVRGFAAAADYYFGAELKDLDLPQCALTAALVNGAGFYNPFTHPDNAKKRRARVLDRMVELKYISKEAAETAKNSSLPQKQGHTLTEPAPYFVSAVRKQLQSSEIDASDGLKVFTTLNLRAQEEAHQAINTGIESLEKNFKNIQKLKASGKTLEALFISGDPETGYISSLIGGRSYTMTHYNRAIESHRQVARS